MKKAFLATILLFSTTCLASTAGQCERDIMTQMLNLRRIDSTNKHSNTVTYNLIYSYVYKLAKAVCD